MELEGFLGAGDPRNLVVFDLDREGIGLLIGGIDTDVPGAVSVLPVIRIWCSLLL